MAELVSKAYAEALFEVGIDLDRLDGIQTDYTYVIDVFKSHPELLSLYKSPQVNGVEKKDIIKQIFEQSLSSEMMNFLNILIDKSRTSYVEKIYRAYLANVEQYKKEITAVVKTVVPLSKAQEVDLAEKLHQLVGKKITIENIIDPSLVGGVMIKMGDQVLDGSLKRRLSNLKESLVQVTL